jgi:hypothetical protein
MLLGCGDSADDRLNRKISQGDQATLERIAEDALAWNRDARPWVEALEAQDRDRFLAVHARSVESLREDVAGMEAGASQITEPTLRSLMIELGRAYHDEFNAMVAIGEASRAKDLGAANRHLTELKAAHRRQSEATDRLAERFPELGRQSAPGG